VTEDDVLNSVPGPSPWYLDNRGLETSGGLFRWQSAGRKFPGKTVLIAPHAQPVLVLGFQCYVHPVQRQVLIWHADSPDETKCESSREITLLLLNLNYLRPLKLSEALQQDASIVLDAAWSKLATISLALAEGTHAWSAPPEFGDLPELLILGQSSVDSSGQQASPSAMNLCLYVLSAKTATVSVAPQHWFNKGNYDFGYQWPSRVARHPETQEIVGEGVRIGRFVLDQTGKTRIR
jgi:hypothetical protein